MSRLAIVCILAALLISSAFAQVQGIVGQHDDTPLPSDILTRIQSAGQTGWVTVAVGIGTNPADMGGGNFTPISSAGHTPIIRLNAGFFPTGTIPITSQYGNFATRCANYVSNTSGATHWIIGNETNLAVEWPESGGSLQYISPADYAECYRQCYNAIKAVAPNDQVLVQSFAPWGGPYGPGNLGGFSHPGQGYSWIDYMHSVLEEIDALGITPDGLTGHINTRGYNPATVFNDLSRVNAAGLTLGFGWEVHREWIMFGTPPEMWDLPVYCTESNGLFWWKGGGPASGGDPAYQAGWMQGLFSSVDDWNQSTRRSGMPPYRSVNLYRWGPYDDWSIQALASGNPAIHSQMMSDLDSVLTQGYTVPHPALPMTLAVPGGVNVAQGVTTQADTEFDGSNASSNAVDGVIGSSNKWTSTSGNNHWIRLDLGQEYSVTGVRIHHAQAGGESGNFNTRLLRLESADSSSGPWRLEGAHNNTDGDANGGGDAAVTSLSFSSARSLRHLRVFFADTGTDGYARIPEIEVYANTSSAEQVIDNMDFNCAAVSGDWQRATASGDKYGDDYWFIDSGSGTNSLRWAPSLTHSEYRVDVWYPEGANRVTDAHYTVVHANGSVTIPVNQETGGGAWVTLGAFEFNDGDGGYVELTDESSQAGQAVVADAVRFVPTGTVPVELSLFGAN